MAADTKFTETLTALTAFVSMGFHKEAEINEKGIRTWVDSTVPASF